MEQSVKTLIYKRTHTGDPDQSGVFGIYDCMGRVRAWDFDAVIGVGGSNPDLGCEDIAGKVTWIGIGAQRVEGEFDSPSVTFDWFRLWDETGPDLQALAPNLYHYMFIDQHVRSLLSQNLADARMQSEVQRLLSWARDSRHRKRPPVAKKRLAAKSACSCR